MLKHIVFKSALIAFICSASIATHARADEYKQINVPAGDLIAALKTLAQQSGIDLVYRSDQLEGLHTQGIAGTLSPQEAVTKLLEGTPLILKTDASGAVLITLPRATTSTSSLLHAGDSPDTHETPDPGAARDSNQKGFWSRFRLAQAETPSSLAGEAQPLEDSSTNPQKRVALEEIIVTAQKRASTLQSTPISLSVLGGEELERRSLVSADDYLSTVPGVHVDSYGLSSTQLVIRGLGLAVGQTPTAGAYLNDVPLSDALDLYITDVKLVDMQRVEVLRGPQGTLYGAGAMGGAVRQVPQSPVLDQFEGRLKVGYGDTSESSDSSYSGIGIVNLPLAEDTLALRVAGYHFKKAGFVDMASTSAIESLSALTQVPVATGEDVGGHEYSGARATALLKASDRLDATLMLGYQKLREDGRSELNMSSGRYVDSALATADELREQEFKFANLVIDYDLDWATLTSSTSLTGTDSFHQFSHTRVIPSASNVPSGANKDGLYEELRLATNLQGPVQFVGGAYYEDVELDSTVEVNWVSPNLDALFAFWGRSDPNLSRQRSRAELKQLAFFGELTYQLAESLSVTAGARWFDYERHNSSVNMLGTALGVPPTRSETGDLPAEEDGQVFKLGIDYKPLDNALIYAIWSQGFRLGVTTDNSSTYSLFRNVCDSNGDGSIDGTSFPFNPRFTIESDRLNNYELGSKLTFLDGRMSVNAAAYRIDWKDVPVTVAVSVNGLGCSATFNGGEARSQGLEFETALAATEHLQVNLSGSLTDTEYLDDLADRKGDRLPFSPKYNANIGLQYNFDVMGRSAFVRSDLSYVGRSGTAQNRPNVLFTDAYRKLGARAGIAFDKLNLEIYGANLTNENAIVGVFNLDRGWRMEPRVIGMEITFDF